MRFLCFNFLVMSVISSLSLASLPDLGGKSFDIVVIEADGFVNPSSSNQGYDGYVVKMISDVAALANFTYNLKKPSGWGASCVPRRQNSSQPHNVAWNTQYLCGQEDVLSRDGSIPQAEQKQIYWSMYYVSNPRLLEGGFSLPFKPPTKGLTMYGTAIGIRDLPDLVLQQKAGSQNAACAASNAAYTIWLRGAFPDMELIEIENTVASVRSALEEGTCEVIINAEFAALKFVKDMATTNSCNFDGKPVGIIGDSLPYGLTQMAAGWNLDDVSENEMRAINYWLNDLMTCVPGVCSDGLAESWEVAVGDGEGCGYGKGGAGRTGTVSSWAMMVVSVGIVGFLG